MSLVFFSRLYVRYDFFGRSLSSMTSGVFSGKTVPEQLWVIFFEKIRPLLRKVGVFSDVVSGSIALSDQCWLRYTKSCSILAGKGLEEEGKGKDYKE